MASMTIRNLEDRVKTRLRIQAAQHGRSMEEEAREILANALSAETTRPANIYDAIRSRFAPLGGIDLPEIERSPMRPVDLK
jgi:plasmid stability protein